MKTYQQEINGKLYQYFYDHHIKLWTIYQIDQEGNQLSFEADHSQNKKQLLVKYPALTFKTNQDAII